MTPDQSKPNDGGGNGLALQWRPIGKGTSALVTATLGGEPVVCEKLDLGKPRARSDFAQTVCNGRPGIDQAVVEGELLKLAATVAARPEDNGAPDAPAQPDPGELLKAMPQHVQAAARAMLESPDLLERIGDDFSAVGIAGERTLAGTVYLSGVSRLLERPLALLVQGPSSSGKSLVLGAVAKLFPPEAVFSATTLSTLSLYYAPAGTFRHRFVVCGERSRKTDEDQAEVTRALRELLSEGRLSRLVTVKKHDGAPASELVEQEGPIAYAESTTLATSQVFTEDLNRMLLLATDERPEQTRRVLHRLAEKYDRGACGDPRGVVEKHHAAQRMLRMMRVSIPYARALMDLLPSTRLEIRRGAGYVLAMIEASALLHQRQRQVTADGDLLATLDDYRVARALLCQPLGRLLGRQVSEGALRFLGRLVEWFGVGGEYTIPEARGRETHSVSGVYGWNSDLAGSGLVELVEQKRGNAPARWKVAKSPDDAIESLTLLPEAEELENIEP